MRCMGRPLPVSTSGRPANHGAMHGHNRIHVNRMYTIHILCRACNRLRQRCERAHAATTCADRSAISGKRHSPASGQRVLSGTNVHANSPSDAAAPNHDDLTSTSDLAAGTHDDSNPGANPLPDSRNYYSVHTCSSHQDAGSSGHAISRVNLGCCSDSSTLGNANRNAYVHRYPNSYGNAHTYSHVHGHPDSYGNAHTYSGTIG